MLVCSSCALLIHLIAPDFECIKGYPFLSAAISGVVCVGFLSFFISSVSPSCSRSRQIGCDSRICGPGSCPMAPIEAGEFFAFLAVLIVLYFTIIGILRAVCPHLKLKVHTLNLILTTKIDRVHLFNSSKCRL